jgi:hypothetical protein
MAQTRRRSALKDVGIKSCHPRIKGRNGECLPPELLKKVGSTLGAPRRFVRKGGRALKGWITRRTRCKSERCWVEKTQMDSGEKKMLITRYFRPTMPDNWEENKNEWLDTLNITEVIKQYEEAYPEFKFFGANPIDFSAPDPYKKGSLEKKVCLQDEICKLDLKKLVSEGKTKLGFVYNLDPSNKGGSHWIASFTDIPAHRSYYFDSYGYEAPPQIARFLRSLTLQDPLMKLQYNARKFQYGDTECGMYSLYFIIRMLKGDNFRRFCRNPPSDGEMTKLRDWIYSKKN